MAEKSQKPSKDEPILVWKQFYFFFKKYCKKILNLQKLINTQYQIRALKPEFKNKNKKMHVFAY